MNAQLEDIYLLLWSPKRSILKSHKNQKFQKATQLIKSKILKHRELLVCLHKYNKRFNLNWFYLFLGSTCRPGICHCETWTKIVFWVMTIKVTDQDKFWHFLNMIAWPLKTVLVALKLILLALFYSLLLFVNKAHITITSIHTSWTGIFFLTWERCFFVGSQGDIRRYGVHKIAIKSMKSSSGKCRKQNICEINFKTAERKSSAVITPVLYLLYRNSAFVLGVLGTHLLKSCACWPVLSCYHKAEFMHAATTVARVQNVPIQHALREYAGETIKGFGRFWVEFLSKQESFVHEGSILWYK